jgi:uncharacterized membrane protein HdeD (DUF308 family)
MAATGFVERAFHTVVRKEATQLIWLGVALLIIGIVALVFPALSTMVATAFVAWVLVFSGAATLFGAFSMRGAGPFFGAILFGALSVAAGVFMLARPVGGELAITLSLGMLFMLQGATEAVFAFELRPASGWVWMLISALGSVLLSLVILAGWPGVSLVALGIVLGVNFISSGSAYLMLGLAAKRDAKA